MDVLTFAALLVGDCFTLSSGSVTTAAGHRLRKLDNLRAEYVDGSATVPVPAATLVRKTAFARLRRAS